MNGTAQSSAAGAGGLLGAFGLGGVVGTLAPLLLVLALMQQGALTPLPLDLALAGFVGVNGYAAVLAWRRAGALRDPLWRDMVRMLVVPWLLNVLLVTVFAVVDLGLH